MRSATAPLVGAGVAAAASLAAWPVVILVANSPLVAAGENGAAAELMWGLLLGALGGASGAVASGAVSRRDGPRSAFAAVLAVAVRDRPLGVTPEAWLRYMNDVDVRGAATLGIGVATAVVVSVATERSATRAIGAALGFGLLFVLSTPLLAFWSACYAGDVLAIFRWLGPRSC